MRYRSIHTELWYRKLDDAGEPNGYLYYAGQRTVRQVETDLIAVLKTIQIDEHESNALDLMEWCSRGSHSKGDDFPQGQVLVTVCQGSNEGYHIVILSRQRNGTAATVFTIKYLIDAAEVWRIAEQIDREFEIH